MTTTLAAASEGPSLWTASWKVTCSPAATEVPECVLTMLRSATVLTVIVAVSELSSGLSPGVLVLTVAVLVMLAPSVTPEPTRACTRIW